MGADGASSGTEHGLAVRWSLAGAPAGVEDALASYVEESSHARFTGLAGLRFKTWRMRRGEWFEGCYVFETVADRSAFEQAFTADAASSPVSQIVGVGPELVEPFEVVAVAEGGSGFRAAPTYR
jgi:hypothetical protein